MDSTDGKIERAKDNALGKHDSNPSAGDQVGEAAGGISGVLAGAAIGSVGGPVGTLIGGIAGAIGGWWSGRAVSEAAGAITHDDDGYYQKHYESSSKLADRSYEQARPAYHIGHLAGNNPDYQGKSWDQVEPDLQKGWSQSGSAHGDWNTVKSYASEGFNRGRSTVASAGHKVANAADDMKDRVDGNPASKPGPDATDRR